MLHTAVLHTSNGMPQYLLKIGATCILNITNKVYFTLRQQTECINWYFYAFQSGQTPLALAAKNGRIDIVRCLLNSHNADTTIKDLVRLIINCLTSLYFY